MPAPSNANNLTLGRPIIDASTINTLEDVRQVLANLNRTIVGSGWPSPARKGDAVYMDVYAQPDGLGAHILYGGNPQDPLNPHIITVSAAGSATVIWQEEGSTVITSGTANFVGDGVTVTDEGDGRATITIPGGFPGRACGLDYNEDGKLIVDRDDLIGPGLEAGSETPCNIRVALGCGLGFDEVNNVTFDPADVAGNGLEAGSGCTLRVKASCGVIVGVGGVSIDADTLAGAGLVKSGTCSLAVNPGCGIEVEDDLVKVDAAALAGDGLVNETGCELSVAVSCGLTISGGAVEFAAGDVAGDYLSGTGCELNVVAETVDIITAINSASLSIAGGSLTLTINYTKRTGVKVLDDGTSSTTNVTGSISVTECEE